MYYARVFILIAVVVGLVFWWARPIEKAPSLVRVELGQRLLWLEMALTPEEREKGLSQREYVEGDGMVFVFPERGHVSFWNREMLFALRVLWIDGERVVGSVELPPRKEGERTIVSPQAITAVIELPLPQSNAGAALQGAIVTMDPMMGNGVPWQPLVR